MSSDDAQIMAGDTAPKKVGKPLMLFVDHSVPRFDQFAGARTSYLYLQLLVDMGLEVVFLPEEFDRPEPWTEKLEALGIDVLDKQGGARDWQAWLEVNGKRLDYVFFNKPGPTDRFFGAIKRATTAAVIYQCHDLHYLRMERQAALFDDEDARRDAARMRKLEGAIIEASDAVLTFSDVEAGIIEKDHPGREVFRVPLYFFDAPPRGSQEVEERRGLLFVGSCAHRPNHDGLLWFCTEIMPLVQARLPDISLDVVGANPPKNIRALESRHIRIRGQLSDEALERAYASARLMVVPLRFGAGVKGKVIEALHHGLTLVSTSVGLEGIPGIEELLTPFDSPADFANRIVTLYPDESRLEDLGRRGQAFAAEHFSRARAREMMSRVLLSAKQESSVNKEKRDSGASDPMLIAFHLPQFHPIPENDQWWGEGFTDWTNVRQARPLFDGHYQPHEPADLGYYDLREPAVREAQADLARQYGIGGFCYYHYWFNGQRLLEQPVAAMLAAGKPDFPFCLCWANENWTRRWDGEEQQVLVRQSYSDEDDRRHLQSLIPFFSDERYIRIDGKPLFLVYRTGEMPDPAHTAAIWREEARAAGIGDLYLCHVESLDSRNPSDIGFDAAVEFAPDWHNKGPALKPEAAQQAGIPDAVRRANHLHSYSGLAEEMLAKAPPDYTWFRCVTPSWDNTARRKSGANVFLGASPKAFEQWLTAALADTRARLPADRQFLFINAWNEWAEGCHLEPDRATGHRYLEAVRKALEHHRSAARQAPGIDQAAIDQYRIESLQRRLEHRERLIEAMQNSTSWRLTRPVRWIKERILAVRDALRRN